jgi:hypothetical protein
MIRSIRQVIGAFILVLSSSLMVTQSHAADGFSLGVVGGLTAGSINHFKSGTASDPVKGGLIGITYGYQAGVDVRAAFLWAKALYQANNIWVSDYTGSEITDYRFLSTTLTVPLMFRIQRNGTDAGVGVYYAHPLNSDSVRDSGMALSLSRNLGGKFFWDFMFLGGFRESAQRGYALQSQLNLGFKLK